jgi:hypothetical protein
MRWGLVRDPQGQVGPQAWRCPDRTVEPGPSLQGFVRRWRLDVTGPEARAQLGRETPRPWNARAMARTTPALLGRFSLMPLWAGPWPQAHTRPVRQAVWSRTPLPTLADAIAIVRRHVWTSTHLYMSPATAEMVAIPGALLNRLTETLC